MRAMARLAGAPLCAARLLPARPPQTAEAIARSVAIDRDQRGVPHIYGPSAASVTFALMYAQERLYSEPKFKPARFDFADVKKNARRVYHPGE